MKVLLTGANGFVGSHVLDLLRESRIPARILLRKTSDTRFIDHLLSAVEVNYGSLDDERALDEATKGIECVIHCAGKTKVLKTSEYYQANQLGTRNIVQAANRAGTVKHFVHISSRAVSGPSTGETPVCETDAPAPISEYGKSKLAGEKEVTSGCKVPYTILRPSAVYGPRDTDFLTVFKAVRMHLRPLFRGGRQEISLVYVKDVACAVFGSLGRSEAFGKIYHIASSEITTTAQIFDEIASQMKVWTIRLPLPIAVIYPVALSQELISRLTGKANILSRQKYIELKASGWVCSVEALRRDLGLACNTTLRQGVGETIEWYRRNGWL